MTDRQQLIHIGYHKTASTWLQMQLFDNPDAGFVSPYSAADIKRLLITRTPFDFDLPASKAFFASFSQPRDDGLVPVISRERLSGAMASSGYDSREYANNLYRLFPGAKILIVIREQKDMLWSSYNQYIKSGCGPLKLRHYLGMFQNPVMTPKLPVFGLPRFEYHLLIEYYQQLFGATNVLVLPYELFREDPACFVRQIADYCSAPLSEEALAALPFERRANRAMSALAVELKRIINRLFLRKFDLNPSVLLPLNIDHSRLKHRLMRLDERLPRQLKERWAQSSAETIATMVGNRYQQSNGITAALTGLDLSRYGYDMPPDWPATAAADRVAA